MDVDKFLDNLFDKPTEEVREQVRVIYRERLESARRLRRITMLFAAVQEELEREQEAATKAVDLRTAQFGKWLI